MRRARTKRRNKGIALHEAMVALLITGAVLVAVVQLLAVVAAQQRLCRERAAATREVGNVMEQLMAEPWDALADERVAAWQLSASVEDALPGAELDIQVADEAGQPGLRRITVQIGWPDDGPASRSPVRLVAWRARPGEGQR